MKKLKVVYQCCDLPGSQAQSLEQIRRLLRSDLADNADIYLSLNGDITKFLALALLVEGRDNIRLCHTSERSDLMEYPALMLVKDLCDQAIKDEYILYFHLKGITHTHNQGIHDWRKFMEYWHIDRWRDCIDLMDQGYDTCGTNYIHGPFLGVDLKTRDWAHYSGGFWWANSNYVKKLKRLPHPDSYVAGTVSELTGYTIDKNTYRFDHEAWIGSGNPNKFEIARSFDQGDGHYFKPYPRNLYRQD